MSIEGFINNDMYSRIVPPQKITSSFLLANRQGNTLFRLKKYEPILNVEKLTIF